MSSASRSPFRFALLFACALVLPGQTVSAQRPDSTRVRGKTDSTRVRSRSDSTRARTTSAADTLKPPITPRRAFLYSALVPGLAQSKLGRNRAAAIMLTVEAVALAMIRESGADVREARGMTGSDSIVVVSNVDANGNSETPVTVTRRFNPAYVHVRQSHVEDWVAFLIANHLFSGADAFVAANLWDISTQLQVRVAPGGASVGAKLTW